jgi:transcription elongation factor Elf1
LDEVRDDPLETLDIYSTLTQAEWARMLLRSRGIPATLLDARMAGMYNVNVVGGVRLQVRRTLLGRARQILAEHPYTPRLDSEREARMEEDVLCPGCGSEDLAAVALRDSRTGTYALRCLACEEQFPVGVDTYLREDFPLLPAACPQCGSARLHNIEAPEGLEEQAGERQWVACDACAHEFEAPAGAKSGTAPGGKAPLGPKEGAPDVQPAACPVCASLQVMEAGGSCDEPQWVKLRCLECNHAWMEDESGQQVSLDGLIPPSDEEVSSGLACPACAGRDIETAEAPAYAVESALGGFLKHLVGRGWYRCKKCGQLWER